MKKLLTVFIAAILLPGLFSSGAQAALLKDVDLELLLAVDMSGSIDLAEKNLQKDGYVSAFRDADIINAIMSGPTYQSIAVSLVYWSSARQNGFIETVVEWTEINNSATSNVFADLIYSTSMNTAGNTGVGEALIFSADSIAGNLFEGTRKVIDLSGDGEDNDLGETAAQGRDYALDTVGIDAINGLAILNDFPNLDDYYSANVIGGTNSFVLAIDTFDDIGTAVRAKILTEVQGPQGPAVPEPATMLLLGTGLVGLAGAYRRKKKNQA